MCGQRAGATMASVNPRLSTASQGGPVNTSIHTNVAARMGRWSASHRKVAIFGWFAFVIAAIAIGTAVGQKSIEQQENTVGQAHRGDQIVKQGGFAQSGPLTEVVAIQSKTRTVHDPAFRAVVEDVRRSVAAVAIMRN